MATRHDNRRARNGHPVRNALLKWQLQQDQRRLAEVRHRLMRMAAPSPASSLGDSSFDRLQDRRPTARRTRPLRHADPEEDALMHLIMEREQREASTSNQTDRPIGVKPSKLQYPSVLPPLRRPEGPKPSLNGSVKNVTLRPTGQKLNAAGDFYSPVRPREAALNSSDFRQNLAISRIKAPAPKRLVGAMATPSPRNPLRYDEMKTPDRWRTTAMRSNQEEFNESALRRWEEEDARQADRLLEKAARDGDDEALWNDLFYGTKAARAKTNQQPEQPVVYSTSSFPEVFSRSRSNSHGSSCYEAQDEQSPQKHVIDDVGMQPSDLSTIGMSEQAKHSTAEHSYIGSPDAASNETTPATSTQTIAELLASMEKVTETGEIFEDLVSGDDQNFDGFKEGGNKDQFSCRNASEDRSAQISSFHLAEFPRWSVIVVATCLVVGTSGFLIEEIMGLMGLFSTRSPFTLSRAEQDRMRERVGVLQQELQGFQESTSNIEVKSQKVLSELQRYTDKMRHDRERHHDMLTSEMQELRRHILDVTHELVEKERESIHTKLKELVKIQIISDEDDRKMITGNEVENEKSSVMTSAPTTGLLEINVAVEEAADESESDSSAKVHEKQLNADQRHDHDVTPVQPEDQERLIPVQPLDPTNNAESQVAPVSSDESLEQVVASQQPLVESSGVEFAPQISSEQEQVDAIQEQIDIFSLPALDQSAPSISVKSASKVATIAKTPRSASGISLEGILLSIGIMFLAACVVLRAYNINRRKRWFEARRKRRNQRALLLAQQRARAMADNLDDSDEWDGEETDGGVEEVSLMTPVRESEDDESRSEVHQSPEYDTELDDLNPDENVSYSPAETYRVATTEQRATTSRSKPSSSPHSPLQLHQRSPRQRRSHRLPEYQ